LTRISRRPRTARSKRAFDVTAALLALIVFSPVIAVVALLVRLTSPGPVIFRQSRLGLDQQEFTIYKFRTMRHGSDATGAAVMTHANDPRLTRIGAFLRSTGLDELPQLWNVLAGSMSLVGPRPPVPHHPYPRGSYPDWALARFEARPGLTGFAQVSGRNSLTWEDRIRLDVEYVNKWSWALDIQILLRTVRALNSRVGLRHTKGET